MDPAHRTFAHATHRFEPAGLVLVLMVVFSLLRIGRTFFVHQFCNDLFEPTPAFLLFFGASFLIIQANRRRHQLHPWRYMH